MSEAQIQSVSADQLVPGDPTPGVAREAAIVVDGLWSGRARTEAGVTSGWHHHGEHDTIIYVVTGAIRVETAAGSDQADVGGFVYVPAHVVHRESNPTSKTAEVVVVRRGSGPGGVRGAPPLILRQQP
jgi:uncharacterized RmlC-like cupin family protein